MIASVYSWVFRYSQGLRLGQDIAVWCKYSIRANNNVIIHVQIIMLSKMKNSLSRIVSDNLPFSKYTFGILSCHCHVCLTKQHIVIYQIGRCQKKVQNSSATEYL